MPESISAKSPENDLQKWMKALLLAQIKGWKQREQIVLLDRAGVGQKEIASLLGTTSNNVSVRLAELRKESKSKG